MTRNRRFRKTARAGRPAENVSQEAVAAAGAAVEQARETLRQRQESYQQTVENAAQQVVESRALTVGDLVDGTLEFVRRHPAAAVLAAGVLGFLLGRGRRR